MEPRRCREAALTGTASYLDAALEVNDRAAFLLALRQVAEARPGGLSGLADSSGLNRESLYRTLSEQGNPELASLDRLLHAVGLRLAVKVGWQLGLDTRMR